MTSDGNDTKYFPENQLIKLVQFKQ